MRTPVYTNRFNKDLKLMLKRGSDPENIKSIIHKLIDEIPLEHKHRDHLLVGNFKDRRECHIAPDWLLIYRLDGEAIIFERTGTHAERGNPAVVVVSCEEFQNLTRPSSSLRDFFRQSPLYDSNIDLERSKDLSREVPL